MEKEILILDTNIWISYAIKGKYGKLISFIRENRLTVITCLTLIQEFHDVLLRKKFRKYIPYRDVSEYITIHMKVCSIIDEMGSTASLSDPKDNFLLNLFDSGRATCLVTGDKELIKEATRLNYKTITLQEFEEKYNL